MRAIHILSVITLLGGIIFWRFVADGDNTSSSGLAARWRTLAYASIGGVLLSGLYNFGYKMNSVALPRSYHAVFGIKFLLALHVFAVALLLTKETNTRRRRQLTGIAISGTVIVILSAILRYLSSK